MKLGIVGLPNVGKSTLFNSLTKAGAESANYPFCTIDPNVGVVAVPDDRLDKLAALYNSAKITPAVIEFVDIAGLVKGASKGEGLGNQFLSHIRETDAIIEVVRCFENSEIIHVENSVDPVRDVEIINLELVMADLDVCTNRLGKIENKARISKDKESLIEVGVLTKIKERLQDGKAIRGLEMSEDETKIAKNFNFLTLKPIIYVGNVSDSDLADPMSNPHYKAFNFCYFIKL